MSNTFNISRFGLLLKRQWAELGKIYLVSLLVLIGVFSAFYYFNLPLPGDRYLSQDGNLLRMDFREPMFLIVGFLFISIISSNYFAPLGQKPRAMVELMLPGSVLEKFLAAVLFTTILSTLSYLVIFQLVDMSFVMYAQGKFDAAKVVAADGGKYQLKTLWEISNGPALYPLFASPVIVTSLFLLGSVYFNRFHYIKTSIFTMIFVAILSYVIYQIGELMFEGKIMVKNNSIDITEEQGLWIATGVIIFISLFLWVIGYVRLKEKEV